MRVSIVEHDPGYVVDPYSYEVLLDGQLVVAVTADEESGEVWEWDLDAYAMTGDLTTRRRHGRVKITRREQSEIEHPEGTVGFLDPSDGFWVWCRPDDPGYQNAVKKATHYWNPVDRSWLSPRTSGVH